MTRASQHGPAISRHRLGTQLRHLRHASGLRLDEVAGKLGVAASTISRIETGQAPARIGYVCLMLDLYGVTDPDQRELLTALARDGQHNRWQARYRDLLPAETFRYLSLETSATFIRAYAIQVIPGLLQTPDYTAAACRAARPGITPGQVHQLVALTEHRQELLTRDRFQLHALIDETALHKPVASLQVMNTQLAHLAGLAESPHVTVQVVSLATPWPVLSPPLTILSFDSPADPDATCTPTPAGHVTITTRDTDTRAAAAAFTALARAALTPQASARLITDLART